MLDQYTGDTAARTALKDVLDSMFRSIARRCQDEGTNVEAAVAQAFAAIEETMTQHVLALRLILMRLAEARAAGLDVEVELTIQMLEALEDMFLDAAEEAADHSARPVQRELLKNVLTARIRGTRLGVIAASARRDVAALLERSQKPTSH